MIEIKDVRDDGNYRKTYQYKKLDTMGINKNGCIEHKVLRDENFKYKES